MSRRVLVLATHPTAGVARHIAQQTQLLSANGDAVLLVAPPDGLSTIPVHEPVKTAAIDIDRITPLGLGPLATLRQTAASTDVIHAHGARAGAAAVVATRSLSDEERPRIVVTIYQEFQESLASKVIGPWYEETVVHGADVILAGSDSILAGVQRKSVARSVAQTWRHRRPVEVERAVIPSPAAAQIVASARARTADSERERQSERYLLGLPVDGPMVLSIAGLTKASGLETLLAAARAVKTPRMTWVVVGDGPLREELDAATEEPELYGRLVALGQRDDIAQLLSVADVFVNTAQWEGQALALQEALASGVAIVATQTQGAQDVAGVAAVLVPIGDAPAIATAVDRLLSDPLARSAQERASRARARTLPTTDDLLDQLVRVYDANS